MQNLESLDNLNVEFYFCSDKLLDWVDCDQDRAVGSALEGFDLVGWDYDGRFLVIVEGV